MAGAHLAHNVTLGDRVIIANNALLGGYVQVGERVFIGGGCVFHQHIHVGRLAICQGGSAFSKDIPPFTTAAERNGIAGLNVVGLRRAGFSPVQRAEIKAAFHPPLPQRPEHHSSPRRRQKAPVGPRRTGLLRLRRRSQKARNLRFPRHPQRWRPGRSG